MRLSELLGYDHITVQCHNIPDADAIGSGYGLYEYFKSMGKDVDFVYGGRASITKSNLVLMNAKLDIPIRYIDTKPDAPMKVDGLLITVDCQYGAGNVSGVVCDDVAIIDHHQVEITGVEKSLIVSSLGSCSTLVWKLLKDEGFDFKKNPNVGTALFFGLYSDTNSLSEIRNPLDCDMRDEIVYDKSLLTLFKNSNISLNEFDITGNAIQRCIYDDNRRFAIIKSDPCDPNILGVISDFLLQVDVVESCLVYNDTGDGLKISVRSCVKEVNASELAAFLAQGVGSGGGHLQKAGGFISKKLLTEKYPELSEEEYFKARMEQYFDSFEIVYAATYEADLASMEKYSKKKLPIGYVKATDIFPVGTPILVRTLEGDMDLVVEEDLIIIIGVKGEVYPNRMKKFMSSYQVTDEKYKLEQCVISPDYVPTIKKQDAPDSTLITEYAKVCIPTGDTYIYAKPLDKGVKVFTAWDPDKYMLGKPGDILAVRSDDAHDIYVVEKDIFSKTYDKM